MQVTHPKYMKFFALFCHVKYDVYDVDVQSDWHSMHLFFPLSELILEIFDSQQAEDIMSLPVFWMLIDISRIKVWTGSVTEWHMSPSCRAAGITNE